jgi:hypothetical protein
MLATGSSSSATHTQHRSLSPQGTVLQHAVLLHALRPVATAPNCSLVAAAAARAYCMCGCACTGITCSCVASAPVSTCWLTSGAITSASSSELRHTSLPRPLPQPPLPAPRPQAPPRPQLALRLCFMPTTYRFATACEILLRGAQAFVRCICCTEANIAKQTSAWTGCSQIAQSAPVPSARFRKSCTPMWARLCTVVSMTSSKSLFGMDVARAIGVSASIQTFTFSSGRSGSSVS